MMTATCTNQHSDAVAGANGKMPVMNKREARLCPSPRLRGECRGEGHN